MKDEEIAEEYAENINLDTKWNNPRQTIEDAFLAGLKVGRQDEQLTKAKEIIKEFVFLLTHTRTALDTKTVMQKAEQFLKEIEK